MGNIGKRPWQVVPALFWKSLAVTLAISIAGIWAKNNIVEMLGGFEREYTPQFTDSWLFYDGFARRIDGGCTGWTEGLASAAMFADELTWMAYVMLTCMIWTFHPRPRLVPYAFATVLASGTFVLLCGLTHLVRSATVHVPMYRLETYGSIMGNALISMACALFVGWGLNYATENVRNKKERLRRLAADAGNREMLEILHDGDTGSGKGRQ